MGPFDGNTAAAASPERTAPSTHGCTSQSAAFSGLIVRGSGPNLSDRARVGFYARYCEPHVRLLTEGGRCVLDDPHSWMVAGVAESRARMTTFREPCADD